MSRLCQLTDSEPGSWSGWKAFLEVGSREAEGSKGCFEKEPRKSQPGMQRTQGLLATPGWVEGSAVVSL